MFIFIQISELIKTNLFAVKPGNIIRVDEHKTKDIQ